MDGTLPRRCLDKAGHGPLPSQGSSEGGLGLESDNLEKAASPAQAGVSSGWSALLLHEVPAFAGTVVRGR
jgi:hypothetical protein